jgi:prepilin-type N-terminal cleavage/methylation domain-containing protein/prepilin-type processing-associated H-X9-DG protein
MIKTKRDRQGFTLIELLVVIAIIAILAAILFPVFAQAKLEAKKTQDLSNQKQIGTSLQMYLTDYDDQLPPYRVKHVDNPFLPNTHITGDAASRNFISQLLYPYTHSYAIWMSPVNPQAWTNVNMSCNPAVGDDDNQHASDGCSYGAQNSYGVNNYMFTAGSSTGNALSADPLVETQVAEPSYTLMMTNARYYNVLPRFTNPDGSHDIDGVLNGAPDFDPYLYTSTGQNIYYNYWKYIDYGIGFSNQGVNDADFDGANEYSATVTANVVNHAETVMNHRINIMWLDGHAKNWDYIATIDDLKQNPNNSIWDPYKDGVYK